VSEKISRMNEEDFLTRFAGVFEHSPWIARRVWLAGVTERHDTANGLIEAFSAVIRSASEEQKLALLRAHPPLAVARERQSELTAASRSEQQGAGLDRCRPEEFDEFRELNARYRAKFGFPFIMAVKGYDRQQILQSFRSRLGNDRDREFDTALEQVIRIGGFRITAAIEGEV